MTIRERIINSLYCRKVDRTAVSPFVWTNYVNWFLSSNLSLRDEVLDRKVFEINRYIGFDPIIRTCGAADSNARISMPGWEIHKDVSEHSPANRSERIWIKTPNGILSETRQIKSVTKFDETSAETEFLIKNREDIDKVIEYQPPIKRIDFSRITRCRKMVGDYGVTAPWLQGVFNNCSRLVGLENIMIMAYEQPEYYDRLMHYTAERIANIGMQMAEAGADIISYEGNIATGTMVGPSFFKEYVLKYEKIAVKAIRDAGAVVLYHNCGDCNNMFAAYNELGITALETLTMPPFGDCDIMNAKETLSSEIAVSGNIDQIEFLLHATPVEVYESAKNLIYIWKDRPGFILATSDYLMEGTPIENLKALVNAIEDHGRYT